MLLWAISVLALTFIFRNFIIKYWMTAWLILVGMFFLAIINNLTLQGLPQRKKWNGFTVINGCDRWTCFFNWRPPERNKRKGGCGYLSVFSF
jgi:hypothetical protein